MGHHNVDSRKIWDRVLGDGGGIGRALMRRVVPVLIAEVRESPVTELGCKLGGIDLSIDKEFVLIW